MSRTRLSDFTFPFHFHALEEEMATRSSVLAWSVPGPGESGGLLSMGSHRVGHDWSDLAAAAIKTVLLLLFSHSVVSDSLQPYGLQHARLLCPSLSPGVCSNSCPLSQWCQPTILCHPLLLLPSIKTHTHFKFHLGVNFSENLEWHTFKLTIKNYIRISSRSFPKGLLYLKVVLWYIYYYYSQFSYGKIM